LRFPGEVSKSYHIVAAAKPVVQQLMHMLASAMVLFFSLTRKARAWMMAARKNRKGSVQTRGKRSSRSLLLRSFPLHAYCGLRSHLQE
jgi:hypothetical protein